MLKIRLQLSAGRETLLSIARATLARDGLAGFWRGSGTGVALWVAYMAVQFPAYQSARRALEGRAGEGSSGSALLGLPPSLLSGGLAGVAATLLTYPLDWARTRLAAGTAPAGTARGPLHLFASTGPRQWYNGLLPSLYSIFPAMALTFFFYEGLSRRFDEALQASSSSSSSSSSPSPLLLHATAKSLVCGGLGGGLAKLLTYPLDTVKKRMQVLPLQYPSTARALLSIASSSEGPRGLFKGLQPALLKAVAGNALGFACFEGAGAALVLLGHPLLVAQAAAH